MSESTIVTMQERDMKKVTSRQRVMKILVQIGLYLFLGIMALIIIFPFYWMIISSAKSVTEYNLPVPTIFPENIIYDKDTNYGDYKNYETNDKTLEDLGIDDGDTLLEVNYRLAFSQAELLKLFKNTVIVGIVSTILSLIVTVITAFVFARLEFKGKNVMFAFLLATMMIPGELFTITNYVTVSKWNWVRVNAPFEGYAVLIVPFLVSVFYIYLLRQNFMQIPNELYLAAKVDGTKDLKYLWKVMIPLALPTLISITILKMMGSWNSYVWPRLVAHPNYHLITNGIRMLASTVDQGALPDYPLQMAAVVLVSTPLFLVFIFLRKYIMKGVSRSGIKG